VPNGGVFAVSENVSWQANCANDVKLWYTRRSESHQVSRPSEKVVSRGTAKFECQENRLAAFQTESHHSTIRALVEHTGTNTGLLANCGWHHQTVPKVGSEYHVSRRLPCRESE
jgi:hypothetical protein